MPRSQNAHAYVNAAFLFQFHLKKNLISTARLCFGGINPSFIHAKETEKYLREKTFISNDTFQGAINILDGELNPNSQLPEASTEYRKNLAIGLFYKCILQIAPEAKVNSKFRSGGKILTREISSGKQEFDTYEKNWPLTKNIQKIEADVQCTGEAQFMNDLPNLPGELYGAFVLAEKSNFTIKSIDAAYALVGKLEYILNVI